MEGYFMRLQSLEGYEEKIHTLTHCQDYHKILCLHHKGDATDNPHFHLTVQTTVLPKAFRARMVKMFDQGKGNGHMSIKPWDGKPEANSYMFHEKEETLNKIILNKGYVASDVALFIKMNREIQIKMNESKEKASWKLEELVLKQVQLNPIRNATQRDIAALILKQCFESDKYQPNDFQLKLMSDRILYKLTTTETDKWQVIQSIISRIKWD